MALTVAVGLGVQAPAEAGKKQKDNAATQSQTQQAVTPISQYGDQNSLAEKKDTQAHDTKSLKQAISSRQDKAGEQRSAPARTESKNAAHGLNLKKRLASEEQSSAKGVVIAGPGSRKILKQSNRLAEQYGGNSSDWTKKSSPLYVGEDGKGFQTHWYENTTTGQRVEYKTIIEDYLRNK